MGVWGRTDRLPDKPVMEITTMCGHGMVAAELVERKAREVRRHQVTAQAAARQLAGACVCGIFNGERAARLLTARVRHRAAPRRPARP